MASTTESMSDISVSSWYVPVYSRRRVGPSIVADPEASPVQLHGNVIIVSFIQQHATVLICSNLKTQQEVCVNDLVNNGRRSIQILLTSSYTTATLPFILSRISGHQADLSTVFSLLAQFLVSINSWKLLFAPLCSPANYSVSVCCLVLRAHWGGAFEL